MLTYEKVLEIFEDYLKEDECAEVVSTRHGHALMMWEPALHGWDEVIPCETPDELFDALLEQVKSYHSYLLAKEQGRYECTPEIESRATEMCQPYLEKRREAESGT